MSKRISATTLANSAADDNALFSRYLLCVPRVLAASASTRAFALSDSDDTKVSAIPWFDFCHRRDVASVVRTRESVRSVVMDARRKITIITGPSQGVGAAVDAAYRGSGCRIVATAGWAKPTNDAELLAVPSNIANRKAAERIISEDLARLGRIDTPINSVDECQEPLPHHVARDCGGHSLIEINLPLVPLTSKTLIWFYLQKNMHPSRGTPSCAILTFAISAAFHRRGLELHDMNRSNIFILSRAWWFEDEQQPSRRTGKTTGRAPVHPMVEFAK
jgi:hypothetical protein